MPTSARAFNIEMYEEHLEETSFLYTQNQALTLDPEVSWRKIGEFEERLEAHIDGLVVGDKLALDVCKRRVEEGDSGEIFGAVSVFCRQRQRDQVLTVLEQLDPEDDERATAITAALRYELPDAWSEDFSTLLESSDPKYVRILAAVFGYRRAPCTQRLLGALQRCPVDAIPDIVWALGRLSDRLAVGPLFECMSSQHDLVRQHAAIALMRIGDSSITAYCLRDARAQKWPLLALGFGGGRTALEILVERLSANATPDVLTAIGLLGDPVSVPHLLPHLEHPDRATSAAEALECITGAGLTEAVFVPDEIDEEELFDSERDDFREGKTLDRGDGRPFGSNIIRLSQNFADWTEWWTANRSQFNPGVVYRQGQPMSPNAAIRALENETTPHNLRRHCLEDIAIRYDYDPKFEIDTPVARQTLALAEATAWAKSENTRFRLGQWHYKGRPT